MRPALTEAQHELLRSIATTDGLAAAKHAAHLLCLDAGRRGDAAHVLVLDDVLELARAGLGEIVDAFHLDGRILYMAAADFTPTNEGEPV